MSQDSVVRDLARSNRELQAAIRLAIITITKQSQGALGPPDLVLRVLDKVQVEGDAVLRRHRLGHFTLDEVLSEVGNDSSWRA
jgi:hypothetical protein